SIDKIPFDIRHNRVLIYNQDKHSDLKVQLRQALIEITRLIAGGTKEVSLSDFMNIGRPKAGGPATPSVSAPGIDLDQYVKTIAKQFSLTDAKVTETKYLVDQGYLITVKDAFGSGVTFVIDINGLI